VFWVEFQHYCVGGGGGYPSVSSGGGGGGYPSLLLRERGNW